MYLVNSVVILHRSRSRVNNGGYFCLCRLGFLSLPETVKRRFFGLKITPFTLFFCFCWIESVNKCVKRVADLNRKRSFRPFKHRMDWKLIWMFLAEMHYSLSIKCHPNNYIVDDLYV